MISEEEAFFDQVYAIVSEIPAGKVATYGQIAKLAGRAKNARLVGKALRFAQFYGNFPCHRVINAYGRLAPGFIEQAELLEREGILLKQNGCVDISVYQWKQGD